MPANKTVFAPEQIEHVPTSSLTPYARNSRTHSPQQIKQIAASIKEFGFINPIIVDGDNTIIAGHGRLAAAEHLQLDTVPCVRVEHMTETQRRAYVIADNKLALNAGWDEELLKIELDSLHEDGFNLEIAGFDASELSAAMGLDDPAEVIEDEVPEPPADPVTKPGDLWLLGEHRLLCGDSRDAGQVNRLLAGAVVNLAFTSPPYASQREYDQSSGFKPIHPDEYVDWFEPVAANVKGSLATDGSWFINIKPASQGLDTELYVLDLVLAHARRWGWHFATELCWERNGVPKQVIQRFKNQFEPIYQFALNKWKMRPQNVMHHSKSAIKPGGKGVGATTWNDDQGNGGALASRYKKRKNGSTSTMADLQGVNTQPGEFIGEGMAYPGNRLPTFTQTHQATGHTAAFPVGLPAFFIKAYTDAGDTVYDPFCGSGSTIIAAEQNSRKGFGMEISPTYCDVIVKRWENLTGQKAILESSNGTA